MNDPDLTAPVAAWDVSIHRDASPKLALSEREVASALGVSVRTLFTLRKSGRLRFAKIGSRVVYTPEAIRDFLVASEQAGPVTPAEVLTAKGVLR
jgi:excisionase family DNA binding protein